MASDESLIVGVVRESCPGERRVALMPGSIAPLAKAGLKVLIEPGAGTSAGFPDSQYSDQGAAVATDRAEVLSRADILLMVRAAGANPEAGGTDLERMRPGQLLIGLLEPLAEPQGVQQLADRDVIAFALELVPRITRAQSMDVLSSMATVAGYKAVLLAAEALPRMFPMMMTAAGTVTPARVLVIGAGVAGLQAIATSRRLGGIVQGYDIRPAVKEQVESLGAKFIELDLETGQSEQAGGYAKKMDEEFYRRQRAQMAKVVAQNDVVITTAAIPGKTAPILVTAEMVRGMAPGSVVVDIAAERGGNCELTRPGEAVVEQGVTVLGPLNLPATVPYHASQMYSRNVTTFLLHLIKDRRLHLNTDDEIIRGTLVSRDGFIVHPQVREALGLSPLSAEELREARADAPAGETPREGGA